MEEKSQKKKHDRSFAYLLGRIHGKFWGYRLLIHGYNPDTAKYMITKLGDEVLAEIQEMADKGQKFGEITTTIRLMHKKIGQELKKHK